MCYNSDPHLLGMDENWWVMVGDRIRRGIDSDSLFFFLVAAEMDVQIVTQLDSHILDILSWMSHLKKIKCSYVPKILKSTAHFVANFGKSCARDVFLGYGFWVGMPNSLP